MSIPTLTLRTLKNRNSGIDITVPSVQETEAPLGGISVEYEISVLTSLPFFKTQLHTSEDVVQFSVYKAYREVEDLYVRLQKKFSLSDFPPIPHGNKILACSNEEKQKALENFLMFIAQTGDICCSSIFTQFIGIPSHKMPSLTSQKKPGLDEKLKLCDDTNKKEEKSFLEEIWPAEKEKASLSVNSEIDLFTSAEEIIAENARKKSILECAPDSFPVIIPDPLQNELHDNIGEKDSNAPSLSKNNSVDEDDLFEEVKRQKESRNKETQISESNRKSYQGLFDDIDNGKSNLFVKFPGVNPLDNTSQNNLIEKGDKMPFTSKPSVENSGTSDVEKYSSSKNVFEAHNEKPVSEEAEAKLGNISLFEEQDFGASITIDEEPLFLVSRTDDEKTQIKNPLLAPKLESSDTMRNESSEIEESLDDLLKLTPLPEAPIPPRKEHKADSPVIHPPEEEKKESLPDPVPPAALLRVIKKDLPPRPVPMPRSKAIPPNPAMKKPEVQPRTVFLSKPSVPPKPLLPRPVPPPKPKPSRIPPKNNAMGISTGDKQSSEPTTRSSAEVQKPVDNASGELSSLDLLQYIENEKKLSSAEASLFD